MGAPNEVVFVVTEESLRQRWLTRERLTNVVVEVGAGAGLDLLLFGDVSNAGQPHSFPNVAAPFAFRSAPGAVFEGISYTLVRRPGSGGAIAVRIRGMRVG